MYHYAIFDGIALESCVGEAGNFMMCRVTPPAPAATTPTTPTGPIGPAAAPAPPPPAPITPGLVRTALHHLGLPALHAHTQPRHKTLVNLPTIFYTHPHPYTRTITLLGQPVHIHATPHTYTWHHGDGTTTITTTPGAPYPATDITHQYTHAHRTLTPRVDVTYTGRFRVANNTWQAIPGTVTITGPPTPLRISEATPLLSGDH